ncbi:MAG TPA: hypothetical protein VHP11_13285 [Tepidisphaeraceae bacterium]|nr:hypothetical protein [Tepidisphaeraceae bacterium]
MRTFLILVLSAALVTAAFFTRPGKREFMLYVLDRQSNGGAWSHDAIGRAESISKSVTLHNRLLWTDIEKDGKVLYTGAFSHWFPRNLTGETSLPAVKDLAKLLAQQ